MSRDEAKRSLFGEMGEELKVSRVDDIPGGRADHACSATGSSSTCAAGRTCSASKQIGALQAHRGTAGAYWRGDESQS